MVPTMSEYFGQWKVSRFVLGDKAKGDAFNVVSRLSDIGDILGGLRVIYRASARRSRVDPQQSAQTKRELDSLWSYVAKLQAQEKGGKRFTPQQADMLGRTAQERATAIAGQVTQAAATAQGEDRPVAMRRLALLGVLSAASLWLATGALAAPPWETASAARLALSDAEAEIILGDPAAVQAKVEVARGAVEGARGSAADLAAARRSLDAPRRRPAGSTLLPSPPRGPRSGRRSCARRSSGRSRHPERRRRRGTRLALVREFRPPTRFSRAAADATLALERLGRGTATPGVAATAVRRDLLDTYDGQAPLDARRGSRGAGSASTRAARRRRPRPRLLADPRPVLPRPSAARAMARDDGALAALAARTLTGRGVGAAAGARREPARRLPRRTALGGGDAPPRRAARPVPAARPDRVRPRRQRRPGDEGLRDPGGDHVPRRRRRGVRRPRAALLARDRAAHARVGAVLVELADEPRDREPRRDGRRAGDDRRDRASALDARPTALSRSAGRTPRRRPTSTSSPPRSTDSRPRPRAATGAGAEQARLEAYGVFELGPEQRLRGLAPRLFRGVEGYFWYGETTVDGLVQLVKRKARRQSSPRPAPRSTTRSRSRRQRIGAGPGSRVLDRLEQRDDRLPRGPRGSAHPGGADGEHGRRAAAVPAAALGRRRARPGRQRGHLGRSPRRCSARSPATARSSRRSSRSSRSACCC